MTDSLPSDLAHALAGRPDADGLARTWTLADAALGPLPAGAPATADAWADLERRLGAAPRPARPPQAEDRTADRAPARSGAARTGRWARAVAMLGLAVAAALGGETWWASQTVVTEAPVGARVSVALADGSRVVLNSGSRLTVARGLGTARPWRASARQVALDGEAFFAVARDARRPFTVQTFNADVVVLGTRFNVRAHPGERVPATRVSLESGRVRVAPRGAGRDRGTVVLAPGEATAVLDGRAEPPAAVPASRPFAWRGGGFAVERLPLGDVLAEIERRFSTDVRPTAGVPLDLPVTLYYRDGVTAEAVLHDLALAAGLRYRPLRGGFEVAPAEAP